MHEQVPLVREKPQQIKYLRNPSGEPDEGDRIHRHNLRRKPRRSPQIGPEASGGMLGNVLIGHRVEPVQSMAATASAAARLRIFS
jgi:hypothetical protein